MHTLQATIEHLELITPLFDQYRQFYQQDSDMASCRAFIKQRLAQQQSVIFLALSDDQQGLGFAQLYPSFSSVSMQKLWILNDLYVKKNARRQGVADALMAHAQEFAKACDAKGVALSTHHNNLTAQRLYDRLGYKKTPFYNYLLIV